MVHMKPGEDGKTNFQGTARVDHYPGLYLGRTGGSRTGLPVSIREERGIPGLVTRTVERPTGDLGRVGSDWLQVSVHSRVEGVGPGLERFTPTDRGWFVGEGCVPRRLEVVCPRAQGLTGSVVRFDLGSPVRA